MRESQHTLRSVHLGNERPIWVRAPQDANLVRTITIVLDAEFYRDRIGIVPIIDQLERDHAITSSWFVFVSHCSPEARWVECECHPPFARFLNDELLPWLENRWPQTRAATDRILVGLSYTGLAAAFVALHAAGRFTKVISQSGSFWWNDCWLVGQVHQAHDLPPVAFHLDVGRREIQENVRHKSDLVQVVSQLDSNRRMRDALREKGHPVDFVEFDGAHEFGAWKTTLPEALQWALPVRTNGGADRTRR